MVLLLVDMKQCQTELGGDDIDMILTYWHDWESFRN